MYHLLLFPNDVNLLNKNMNGVKKNTEALVATSKEFGLEVNTEKIKYMFCVS
jgi:hypothetical protein